MKIFALLPTELRLVLTVAATSAACAVAYQTAKDDMLSSFAGIIMWSSIGFSLCYTLLKYVFKMFVQEKTSAAAVSVPAILLAILLRNKEIEVIYAGILALLVYLIWLALTILPYKHFIGALLCIAADGIMVYAWVNGQASYELTDRFIYAMLFVLTAYHIRALTGYRDRNIYPFAAFLLLLIFLLFIPSRKEPINWQPVIDAGCRVADKTKEMVWSLSYYLEDLGLGSSYYTGYSSLAQSGDSIRKSERTEIELKTRDNTTFRYVDEISGKKLMRRRVVYLTGGRAVEHEQLLDVIFSLYCHNIGPDMASLYARNAVLDIDYVYLKTGDEIMPLGTVRLTDGRGDIVNEGYGRKHRKGYSLHAEYLDLDHGSPYIVKVMASPVRSIDRTSVSYKKMSQYAYNTFGIRLDELVGEDQYAAWQKGSGSKEEYLDVSGVTDRMRELAGKITGGYESSYEKCRAVESYLRQYSYRMDTGTSGGGDTGSAEGMSRLADGFLFETGEGYCVHFASSMVMLLRLNGIPARLSSGYRYAFPFDRQEVYEVRAESAHAWPEAYIEGFGWVPFEPTAVLPTAEDRTWHRHPEASATAVDPAYYRPGDEIQVPEPPVHEEAVVEEEEPDNVMDIVKIAAIIAGAVLLMVILIVTGTAAFKALRYRLADPNRRLELDVADITGVIRSASGMRVEDRGIMSDYDPYIPVKYAGEVKKAFEVCNRIRYRCSAEIEEKVTVEEEKGVRELRNNMIKDHKNKNLLT